MPLDQLEPLAQQELRVQPVLLDLLVVQVPPARQEPLGQPVPLA